MNGFGLYFFQVPFSPLLRMQSVTSTKTFVQASSIDMGTIYLLLPTSESQAMAEKFAKASGDFTVEVSKTLHPTLEGVMTLIFKVLNRSYQLRNKDDPLMNKTVFQTDADVMQVDIDSYDCIFIENLLQVASPKVLVVEFNPIFPPSVFYTQTYTYEDDGRIFISEKITSSVHWNFPRMFLGIHDVSCQKIWICIASNRCLECIFHSRGCRACFM